MNNHERICDALGIDTATDPDLAVARLLQQFSHAEGRASAVGESAAKREDLRDALSRLCSHFTIHENGAVSVTYDNAGTLTQAINEARVALRKELDG